MQEIDQEKLSEFNSELSAFQTEASKTASIDVYDRFTISKLEDHVVDLCQLSMDASHTGLQYLCERLRDNIRDHFITGTNISNDEFALMTEWKTLVKAYLVSNENEGVITALAANLSKHGWTYPLSPEDTGDVVSVLLGTTIGNQINSNPSDNSLSDDDAEEFDALMAESNTSLADVFESLNEDDSESDFEERSVVNFIDDKEPSMAAFFEDSEVSMPAGKFDNEQLGSEEENNIEEQSKDHVKDELPEIDQAVTGALANDVLVSDDSQQEPDFDNELDKDMLDAEASFAAHVDSSIDKVEVSKQELDEIDQTVSGSVEDELFVADDSADESEYSEEFDKDVTSAEAALAESTNSFVDKVEVSKQELDEIDQTVSGSVEDELFVADDSADESENNEDFDNKLLTEEIALDDSLEESSHASKESPSEINESVVESLANEFFVTDESDVELQDNDQTDEDLSEAKLEPETVYIEPANKQPEAPRSIIEAYVGVISGESDNESPENAQSDGSLSESVPSSGSASQEAAAAIADELFVEEENVGDSETMLVAEHSQAGSFEVSEPETVYLEPTNSKTEAPRSIIEAYVDVIADKIRGNKPKELEQELIQQPPKPIQKLEPVDSILLKYPDWNEEQKESPNSLFLLYRLHSFLQYVESC